jgi:hypothetical protein
MTSRVPVLLVALFATVAVGLVLAWQPHGDDVTTGDEPHYVAIADAIARDHSFSPVKAYVREARRSRDFPPGAPSEARVVAQNRNHLVHGPHGWYSIHNVGLPMVVAPAAAIGSTFAVRMTMIALGAAIVLLLWRLAAPYFPSERVRGLVLIPLCLSLPIMVASTQIYPDLPGGALCLLGLFAVMQAQGGASTKRLLAFVVPLAYLPWLHLRFALPALILVAAVTFAHSHHVARRRSGLWLALPLVVSASLLALYNSWAFGSFSGPYTGDAVSASWHSAMVLLGLGVDQNQGIVVQQPLHLVGLWFLVPFLRSNRVLGGTIVAVVAAILVPNAAHPAWYGGVSFAGRFGWAASLVFMPVTLFGLSRVTALQPVVLRVLLSAAGALQVWYLVEALRDWQSLYNPVDLPPLGRYSLHFGVLGRWLPALYDTRSALGHVPNAVAVLAVVWLVALGAWWSHARNERGGCLP